MAKAVFCIVNASKAASVVDRLKAAAFSNSDISVLMPDRSGTKDFAVDNSTTVSGTGVGTAGKKLLEAGGKPTLTDFVHQGDTVAVTYHEMAGTKHADIVRITRKKM